MSTYFRLTITYYAVDQSIPKKNQVESYLYTQPLCEEMPRKLGKQLPYHINKEYMFLDNSLHNTTHCTILSPLPIVQGTLVDDGWVGTIMG